MKKLSIPLCASAVLLLLYLFAPADKKEKRQPSTHRTTTAMEENMMNKTVSASSPKETQSFHLRQWTWNAPLNMMIKSLLRIKYGLVYDPSWRETVAYTLSYALCRRAGRRAGRIWGGKEWVCWVWVNYASHSDTIKAVLAETLKQHPLACDCLNLHAPIVEIDSPTLDAERYAEQGWGRELVEKHLISKCQPGAL